MERTLWTPQLRSRYDFKVLLDRDFAKEMIQSRIPDERQRMMSNLASRELRNLGINYPTPYIFYQDSCFVTQVSTEGNGVWLATDCNYIEDLLKPHEQVKPIEYNSHNVDNPHQAYVLMALFDRWVEYSDILRENRKT